MVTAVRYADMGRGGVEAPVKVQLFNNVRFDSFDTHPFKYVPPKGNGKWRKIVLVADYDVTKGIQYDRTAQISIGKVNVYFGTTSEPNPSSGQYWHVERDITDYAALLRSPQDGDAILGNIVNATYTGVLTGSASVLFYPAENAQTAAHIPDVVIGFQDKSGAAQGLASPKDHLSRAVALPRNVVRAYLDVIAQCQGNDEFWYTDVPPDLSGKLGSAGGGTFREVEVEIDGTPAGIAPVYPYIFTGGIDPGLWRPIPGVQTLSFMPYRVNLTPFAGVLDNGRTHTVSVRVVGDNNNFGVTATLLAYCDPNVKVATGAVTLDTVDSSPVPTVWRYLVPDAHGNLNGTVDTSHTSSGIVEGYVVASHGKVTTRVAHHAFFDNRQVFSSSDAEQTQDIHQSTRMTVTTSTTSSPGGTSVARSELAYPLIVTMTSHGNADKTSSRTTTIHQGYMVSKTQTLRGWATAASVSDTVDTTDTLNYGVNGRISGAKDRRSSQTIVTRDNAEPAHVVTVSSDNGKPIAAKR